jgi:hypothetical protein
MALIVGSERRRAVQTRRHHSVRTRLEPAGRGLSGLRRWCLQPTSVGWLHSSSSLWPSSSLKAAWPSHSSMTLRHRYMDSHNTGSTGQPTPVEKQRIWTSGIHHVADQGGYLHTGLSPLRQWWVALVSVARRSWWIQETRLREQNRAYTRSCHHTLSLWDIRFAHGQAGKRRALNTSEAKVIGASPRIAVSPYLLSM